MKKHLIFLSVTLGLCIILGITSRLSSGFSEWYAANVFPLFVGTVGRFFGLFPFSVGEILLLMLLLCGIAGIVLLIIKIVKSKGRRKAVLAKTGVYFSCVASAALLIFILNCGINYNREPFIYNDSANKKYTAAEEWTVYLCLLDELYQILPHIQTDDDGAFVLTGNLHETAPAALRNLAKDFPRLNVPYPRPKPVIASGLMKVTWTLGIYSPYTIEANYNRIAPDSEKAVTAIHELVHVAGFMREEEANFIAFLAARESGDPELVYCGLLDAVSRFPVIGGIDSELYNILPESAQIMFDRVVAARSRELSEELGAEIIFDFEVHGGAYANALLPKQVWDEYDKRYCFWNNITYVYDEDTGEVVDVIVSTNPVAEIISSVSETVNDTYLKTQGQEDGILSYNKMIDLVMAMYLGTVTE